jgi:hypothetical protein
LSRRDGDLAVSSQETSTGNRAEWHDVLLALAGQLTDKDQSTARALLAAGREDDLAQVIYRAISPRHITLPERDAARLLRLLPSYGIHPDDKIIGIQASPGMPQYQFSPSSPAGLSADDPYFEDAEERAVMAAASQSGVRELFRTWRYPPTTMMSVHRIYMAKADEGADLAGIAGHLQDAIMQVGDSLPQVEVYSRDEQLSDYHRKVYDNTEALWVDGNADNIKNARLFDGDDQSGRPAFAPDHPRITDPGTRQLVLGYLSAGKLVETGHPNQDDVLDPAQADAVPGGFKTDGEWIWPASAAYYLERYHLAPDPGLLEHILARGGTMTEPGDAAMRDVYASMMGQT